MGFAPEPPPDTRESEDTVRRRLARSPKFRKADGTLDERKIDWFVQKLIDEGKVRPKAPPPLQNPVVEITSEDDEDALTRSGLYFGERATGKSISIGNGYSVKGNKDPDGIYWGVLFRGKVVGGGVITWVKDLNDYAEEMVGFLPKHRGKGLHRKALAVLREHLGPFWSDDSRTPGNDSSWQKVPGVTFDEDLDRYRYNPPRKRPPKKAPPKAYVDMVNPTLTVRILFTQSHGDSVKRERWEGDHSLQDADLNYTVTYKTKIEANEEFKKLLSLDWVVTGRRTST
jgi:hypothetical protein